MAAIFKSSLQNLSPLPTSLKVEPLAKPKTGLKLKGLGLYFYQDQVYL